LPNWTSLGTVQRATFYDPANTSNTYTVQFNYKSMPIKPGSIRKYTMTTNGTSVIVGDREYPPQEIQLVWDQLDKSDFDALRAFTQISPIVFVDNNDNGWLGVLVIDNAAQVSGLTKNVWAIQASFLVIAPYQGRTRSINVLTAPTLTTTLNAGGYIPNGTTLYFWSTIWTPWGESTVSSVTSVTTAFANQFISLGWSAPTSPYFKKLRIYWNTTNNPTTATMLTEIQAGFSASFSVYGPYVPYSTITPPIYNTAFSGFWSGGIWQSV
jgi:hypothetical protein